MDIFVRDIYTWLLYWDLELNSWPYITNFHCSEETVPTGGEHMMCVLLDPKGTPTGPRSQDYYMLRNAID